MFVKREFIHTMQDRPSEGDHEEVSPSEPQIRIGGVTNDNWRGKNDPIERRRIQNRLNQRAYRQRQRSEESSKQYRPRSRSRATSSGPDEESLLPSHGQLRPTVDPGSVETVVAHEPAGVPAAPDCMWDELARLINRNLMLAASTNAEKLGFDIESLREATPGLTPAVPSIAVPTALQPVSLQREVPHDPMIAVIPHPQLRYNILRAIATDQLDAPTFSRHLRASGALQYWQGQWRRGGLIVWSTAEQVASLELSELFWHMYGSLLLPGCEDLIAATNTWRSRRGETVFPASIQS